MKPFSYKPIHNQGESGSSAFLFDLRNSTKITRTISWDDRLPKHIAFMMKLHEHVYTSLYANCNPNKFAMNDTGDGYICVFWDNVHALTCLKQAIYVRDFLETNLQGHNQTLKLQNSPIKMDYGIGIHSGGSTINRSSYTNRGQSVRKDFIFGIVANTVARLESFTKNYTEYKFLVTGNYKDVFCKQATSDNLKSLFKDNSPFVKQSLGRVNLNDGKKNGHIIYALTQDFIDLFRKYFMACPESFFEKEEGLIWFNGKKDKKKIKRDERERE